MAAILTAMTMVLGLTACGGGSGKNGIKDPAYSDRSTSVKFSYYAGGYGSAWLEAVTKDYMDNVNKDVYIELIPSYDNTTAYADIDSGSATADLYQIEVGVFDITDKLADLTDVYESNAYEEETKIKDKLTPEIQEFYLQDGQYYQMPNTTMTGKDGYDNFNNGLYEEGGKLVLSKENPKVIEKNKTAIEAAYKVAYDLCTKINHYVFGDSASLNYKSADQVFYGGGYGMNRTKVAALYTGAWIETEVADLLEDGIIEKQDITASKMPVISAITSRLSTVKDEKTLAL